MNRLFLEFPDTKTLDFFIYGEVKSDNLLFKNSHKNDFRNRNCKFPADYPRMADPGERVTIGISAKQLLYNLYLQQNESILTENCLEK